MGKFTGNIVKTLRQASRKGDQLGLCEECCKPLSDVYIAQTMRVYLRDDGTYYTSPLLGGIYGHAECLKKLGPFTSPDAVQDAVTTHTVYAELMRKIDQVENSASVT